MFNTPILFLIFKRPDTTKEVFEQIAKVKPTKLYIAADGPRSDRTYEAELCTESKKIVEDRINWDCDVKYLYREENLGCKLAVSGAINWFFEQEESGIILEDDCLPDLTFFTFCEELLQRFKDDNSILAINGCNLGYDYKEASYFYGKYLNSWGWATWRRSANSMKYDMSEWEHINKKKFIRNALSNRLLDWDVKWCEYWINVFDATSAGEINTWDYQWQFHLLKNKQFNIISANNLVKNIGFSDEATHTTLESHPAANIRLNRLKFPLVHNFKKEIKIEYEERYVKPIHYMYRKTPTMFLIKKFVLGLPIINLLYNSLKNIND